MSKYTTEVRYICETFSGFTDPVQLADISSVIIAAAPKIFNNYPIYDEEKRADLNSKILMHYYTREIGLETVGLWKLKLHTKMNEIMPYYNEIYKSLQLEYDPLTDTDYHVDTEGTSENKSLKNVIDKTGGSTVDSNIDTKTGGREGTTANTFDRSMSDTETKNLTDELTTNRTNSGNSHQIADNWTNTSDTPQGSLANVKNLTYLTQATNNTVDSNTTDSGSISGTDNTTYTGTDKHDVSDTHSEDEKNSENWTEKGDTKHDSSFSTDRDMTDSSSDSGTEQGKEHVYGKRGSQSYTAMLKEYREAILNVDMMIIDELRGLFMTIW